MKHLWKILLLIPIIALFQVTYSGELKVESINVIDKNTLKISLSENPNMKQGENKGEITILNDIAFQSALAKPNTSKEVEILLKSEILAETSYSLLTVAGAKGSIDFTTPAGVDGFTQVNIASLEEQDIESIEIVDSKTIIVTYKQDISAGNYDYKLLSESKVVNIDKPNYDGPELFITVEPPLIGEQNYILMIIDIQDVDGKQLEFDTGIYDFKTPIFSPELSPAADGSELPELNAAGEPVSLEKSTLEEPIVVGTQEELEVNLATVASEVKQTPATGTATWILILGGLIINAFYLFTRRKKA